MEQGLVGLGRRGAELGARPAKLVRCTEMQGQSEVEKRLP